MKHLSSLLLGTLLFIASGVLAQGEATDETTVSPALVKQLDDLENNLMSLRELEELSPVEWSFPTREEAIEILIEDAEEQLPVAIIFKEKQFYRAFDFIGADVDLWEVYTTLIADQVAGFYDPDTQMMNILLLSGGELGDSLPPLERITYAHEYVHALQDQHFGLDTLEDIEEPDRALAVLSLVEGDAMLVTEQYMFTLIQEESGLILELLGAIASTGVDVPEGTPAILEAELMMPYLDGLEFVTALYNQGGWEAVNAAFANPPQSTEQILHPEHYVSGDVPYNVDIVAVDDVLGNNWVLLFERTLGEFYLREYLDTQLSGRKASQAAAGWGGDRYQLYYNESSDRHAWMLRLTWDTPEDSAEFVEAYREFAESRMGTPIDESASGETRCWQNDAGEALCLRNQGDVLVAYAPTWGQAAAMIAGQR